MEKIYFDYAAATPVHPEVLRAMRPYFSVHYGNPGSLHSFGQEALRAVDQSRETIARALRAEFGEIIFTSSATEANNFALRGILAALPKEFTSRHTPRIITSSIEHESMLQTCKVLESQGVEVIYLPVDGQGVVSIAALRKALNERTVLVSILYANNHIGTIEPLLHIGRILETFRNSQQSTMLQKFGYPFFHTDAAQALQFLDCDVSRLGVQLMSLSGQKIYGPKGVGALYCKRGVPLSPLITGGDQEKGRRAATENVPGIVGFARALELILQDREAEASRIEELRNSLHKGILRIQPRAKLNGPRLTGRQACSRLPNNLHIYFPGITSQDLIVAFDLAGIAVSSGSACSVRTATTSYVVRALGYSEARAAESIRITLGRPTTKREIVAALPRIRRIVK